VEFFRLPNGRSIQRPSIEADGLTEADAAFAGDIDLDQEHVRGGEQPGVRGEGSLVRTLVERVDLSAARLAPLNLTEVVLRDVDLSNAQVQQVVARCVELTRCRAIGLRASFDLVADLYAEESRFDLATIHVERVKGIAAFRDCSFRDATIRGDLSNVVFDNCDFAGAEFEAARADKCDLRTSSLVGARGLTTLRGAEITLEQAISVSGRLAAELGLTVSD
jgi:uncharacterized protein YjbI with pentapeptide repeats